MPKWWASRDLHITSLSPIALAGSTLGFTLDARSAGVGDRWLLMAVRGHFGGMLHLFAALVLFLVWNEYEPSAWEADRLRLPYCLTCAARCPPLAVRDRW
jgi:hypothetical protein